MKENGHLPIYGPGPLIGGFMIVCTVLAFLLRKLPFLSAGQTAGTLHTVLMIFGIIFILSGIALWIYAVPVSKIDDGIVNNRLVTTGAYAPVRNPIYSSIMIACTGILFLIGNLYFFLLSLLYWAFMTVILIYTEEKWLRELYGQEYEDYYRRVNRCWPWFPKNQ